MIICLALLSSCDSNGAKRVYPCERDSDCIVAISTGVCCPCPFAASKAGVEANKNWVVYGSEEHLAAPRTEGCGGVMCEPCADLDRYNLENLKCEMGECRMMQKMDACSADEDCIPLPSECHPQECINREHEDMFEKPQMCTKMFDCSAAYRPEDCLCQEGRCVNKNLGNNGCES